MQIHGCRHEMIKTLACGNLMTAFRVSQLGDQNARSLRTKPALMYSGVLAGGADQL